MSSKRNLRKRSCESKKQFETESEGLNALKYLHNDTGYKGAVYRCQFCGKYHIGRYSRTKMIGLKGSLKNKNKWK